MIAAGVAAFTGFVISAPTVSASTGQVSAQYQAYSAQGSTEDPYASDNPQDVHIDGFGGQPVVTGYVLLDLSSLPADSRINGLTLSMTPNTTQQDNVDSSAAAIEACPLTQPLTSNGYQQTPPSYSCSTTVVAGEPQSSGAWDFELQPLAANWTEGANNGIALVAYSPPNGTPATLAPSAWSIAFDHTKTVAAVDYTAPPLTPSLLGSRPTLSGPASSGGGFAAPAPLKPAAPTAVPQASPSPTPAHAATLPSPATVPPARGVGQWVWFASALFGAVLLMVGVVAAQQLMSGGTGGFVGRVGSALAASRSQLATPVAVLTLASVLALGFGGQLAGAGGGGGSAARSTGGGGSGTAGGGSGSATGPAGGGASGGGTGGAAGGPGASPSPDTNGGLDGPGVTSTTVRIGFTYVTNSQSANQEFGVQVASVGNEQAEEQALVDYMNKHGGIAGRQIQPVYVAYNNAQAETDPTIGEENCTQFTTQYHVFAVIAGAGPPDDYLANTCYATAETLNFDASQGVPSLGFLSQTSPYIWASEDSALDRTMKDEISGLSSRGYFSSSEKVGVILASDSVNEGVYSSVTLPGIEAAGVPSANIMYREIRHDTLSDTANDMKEAVAAFQLAGVTNVIFQGGGIDGTGSFALLFMLNAESQHYNPTYGLSSDDGPVALAQNVPQDQLKGALSVGTIPGVDTDDQHYGQWPYTADQKTCAGIMASAFTTSTQEGALAIVSYCDAMFELQEGAASLVGQPLNAQLWANSAMKLGTNVFDSGMYQRVVAPNHWDAAGGYRLLHAVQNCETNGSSGQPEACFVYDNSTLYTT